MGVFKLGKMTFGSLFKKPETVMYPLQTKPQPEGLKGHVAIDEPSCILCGMCERSCTTDCITVDKQANTWSIDRFQCVQCGYCISVCPKKCLSMDPNYAPASTKRARDVFEIPAQEKPAAKKKAEPSAAECAPEKAAATEQKTGEPQEAAKLEQSGGRDEALLAAIALMDPEKAQRVKDAIAAR